MRPWARRTDAAVRLPPDLTGPVDVELANLTEEIPAPEAMPGGCRYEPKFDGLEFAVALRGSAVGRRDGRD